MRTPTPPHNRQVDQLGMLASAACALHCALMPLALGVLSIMGAAWIADERLEWALVTVAACFAGASALRSGGRSRILLAFGFGFVCVLGSRLGAAPGSWAQATGMLIGGSLIAVGHLQSLRFSREECEP